ncbi:hypothetical protein L6164_017901 [Bauhinia variegata]|uniref:Uncharacterized protein n=1 Tax=Bauhinia variegata TaxID=167791 RepID=A0ACB9NCX0_BAUVA|nr:hypothetical protein L6164_017901 [Bauhinia variegata]
MSLLRCFLLFLHIPWLASLAFGADTLSEDEVLALRDMAKTLGKHDWNFAVDPCSESYYWVTPETGLGNENPVTCDNCFPINGTNRICHVISIVLKEQNLQGTLPRDLFRLPYLQQFDVTRNYLSGPIPKEWGSTKLVNISLLGNRITGPIPTELGNISTLQSLVLEFNQLSGSLPKELGNLVQLQRLFLRSNNFTGKIPATFAKLTALRDFRIGDNQFSGRIPNIQNWTNLTRLVIQGSGLSGPIPSGISFLTQLGDLRISDLNGPDSTFPQLINVTMLRILILRSCNIYGTLPEYLGTMTIGVLDLSFNKLRGSIPSSYIGLIKADYIYLTGNFLSGSVPNWTQVSGAIDLSYNNFSIGNLDQECQSGGVNLFASSSPANDSGTVSCLRRHANCPTTYNSLHINCGGKQVRTANGDTYAADTDSGGPARFKMGGENWAYSNTGHFMDNDRANYYTWSIQSWFATDFDELYTNARASPNSLTYYGFCLANGTYKVKLHFAEIMFDDDGTYNSLGRRIFDVYIQRKLELKDFNIVEEAGGVGKVITKNFTAVVTNNNLEIHFRWSGKGTTIIPFRSVYGPLISAISVESDENGNRNTSAGAQIGIVAAGVIIIILALAIIWGRDCRKQKSSLARELKQLDLQTGFFSLRQIKAATNNFDITNKIGEGGFGPVYKGNMSDEIVSGRVNIIHSPTDQCIYLLDWAHLLKEKGNLMELVDERILGSDFNGEEAMVMIKVALLCTNATATLRPTMSSVVSMLEGSIAVPDLDADSSEVLDEKNLEAIRLYHQLMKENKESEIQEQLASTDGAWSASSSPAEDLYPLHLDSANWDKRNKTITATFSFP